MMTLFAALIGLVIGSFLNVVIGRLRSSEKGWRSRSRCPECKHVLAPADLVPVFSFFALRGRCRSCRKPISWQYPLIELSTALLFAAAYAFRAEEIGPGIHTLIVLLLVLRDWLFISVLTVVFVIDLRDMVVFDSVTLPAAAIALGINGVLGYDLTSLALAALVGAGFFLLQYVLSRGRWIGGGDIRIGAMIGCMLGFPAILLALLVSYISGAVVALGLLASGRARWSGKIAFGTFLAVGTVFTLFFGQRVIAWYASLLAL